MCWSEAWVNCQGYILTKTNMHICPSNTKPDWLRPKLTTHHWCCYKTGCQMCYCQIKTTSRNTCQATVGEDRNHECRTKGRNSKCMDNNGQRQGVVGGIVHPGHQSGYDRPTVGVEPELQLGRTNTCYYSLMILILQDRNSCPIQRVFDKFPNFRIFADLQFYCIYFISVKSPPSTLGQIPIFASKQHFSYQYQP